MKGRRHLHLEMDILEDMESSGVDISNWAADAWIESSYSVSAVKKAIEKGEKNLAFLKDRLKRNLDFQKKMNKISGKQEIKFLADTTSILKKFEGDSQKVEDLIAGRIKLYQSVFKIRLTKNMMLKKLKLYKEQFGGK